MFRFVFLLPTLLEVFAVFALVVPPDAHTAKHCLCPSKSHPASKITFHKLHSILSAWRHLLSPQKKLHFTAKKTRQPCVFHVGSRSPHSATLHCGLSASATLAPLAVGSRLSTPQAKNHSAIAPLNFLPAPFRLKAALPALFLCYTRANPRPPTPKTVEFLILFALPRRILNISSFCPKKRNMQS